MESNVLHKIEKIAGLGHYETDLTTGKWTASSNFKAIFGLIDKDFYDVEEFQALVHPEDFDEVMKYFSKCLSEHRDFNFEYRCIRSDGKVIYVNSKSEIFYSNEGTPLKNIGIKQDVTSVKLYENKLQELIKLNQKKNETLGFVAHDLRSPIAQIEGIISLIKEDFKNDLTEDQKQLLQMQSNACDISKDIIADLIEITDLEGTSTKLEMSLADINEVIDKCISNLKLKANKKNVTIITQLTDDSKVKLNPKKFMRAIDNLLSNAIKFSEEGQSIWIVTENKKKELILKIIDEGIGIPKKLIPDLFKESHRTTCRVGTMGEKSVGLGLNIVKYIVDMHNGKIDVKTRENEGSTFTIRLKK